MEKPLEGLPILDLLLPLSTHRNSYITIIFIRSYVSGRGGGEAMQEKSDCSCVLLEQSSVAEQCIVFCHVFIFLFSSLVDVLNFYCVVTFGMMEHS